MPSPQVNGILWLLIGLSTLMLITLAERRGSAVAPGSHARAGSGLIYDFPADYSPFVFGMTR